MSTTLDLTTLSRTSLRLLVACCARALCPTLPPEPPTEPYASLWQQLWTQRGWTPTGEDSPLPLATVEAWLWETDADGHERQGKLRQWVEQHGREEQG